jgi:hypothetical protein
VAVSVAALGILLSAVLTVTLVSFLEDDEKSPQSNGPQDSGSTAVASDDPVAPDGTADDVNEENSPTETQTETEPEGPPPGSSEPTETTPEPESLLTRETVGGNGYDEGPAEVYSQHYPNTLSGEEFGCDPCGATWQLDREFDTFTAYIGIADSSTNSARADYEISVMRPDGEMETVASGVTEVGPPTKVELDITDAFRLVLHLDVYSGRGVWIDPTIS